MSVAGGTTVVGDFELTSYESKGKARMPTETTQFDTSRPVFNQVGP